MQTVPMRRRHPRVPAGFLVKLKVGERTLVQKARDLSMTGMLVDCDTTSIGDKVQVELDLPNEERPVSIAGLVLRASRPYGTRAIHFMDFGWDDMFALARFLAPRLP